ERHERRPSSSVLRGAGPPPGQDRRHPVVHVRFLRPRRDARHLRHTGQRRSEDVAGAVVLTRAVTSARDVHGSLCRTRQPRLRRRRAERTVRVRGLAPCRRKGRRADDAPGCDGAPAASGSRASDRHPGRRQQLRAGSADPPRAAGTALASGRPPRPRTRRHRGSLARRRDCRSGHGERSALQGRRRPGRQALRRGAAGRSRPAVPLDPVGRREDRRVHAGAGQVLRRRPRRRLAADAARQHAHELHRRLFVLDLGRAEARRRRDRVLAARSGLRLERRVAARAAAAPPTATSLRVPAPSGRFAVGVRSIALTDRARREPQTRAQPRSMVIRLWYPAGAAGRRAPYMPSAVARFVASSGGLSPALLEGVTLDATADAPPRRRSGGWPVVLFSPGFGVEAELYAGLLEDLASHGYVVVALSHPHDAGIVQFPDGRVVASRSQMDIATALKVRVADTRFVLTQLALLDRTGPFARSLDLGRVGMFGHSLGGAAAAATMLVDSRIRAGADLDGLLFGRVRTSGLSRPFMLMAAEPGFAAEPSFVRFWNSLRGPRYAVDVRQARHFAFSDLVVF